MHNEEHLLYEIKRELDWAAEEVKRTEAEVMRLEVEFNKSIETADEDDTKRLMAEKEHLQERIGLHESYALQRRAAKRFYMISHVYDIASTGKSSDAIREQLSSFMYRSMDGKAENADQRDKLLELAEALMAYFADGHSDEADEAIREAWQNIEETLRELGRR
ncbi:hypothetical protein RYZ26_00880 [Terasakiella sp. A23]|uniref:hypothetical protein n=1 Tax=Terasakiella sp. FCG-A23 TaxID=3080561 RepID=UPI0029537FDC|nr:hypothetical protein [Terasakiella sp. A23]MDV7338129.1 hypothetical protein [Terasakiella sp. A23]